MNEQLQALSDSARLKVYENLISGCNHLWSKGKLQEQKILDVLNQFYPLTQEDPYFLARFTSYAVKKLDSKDLKVIMIFLNFLSDADGTPFSEGSKYKKPNLRLISQAGLQDLDPKLVERIVKLAKKKFAFGNLRNTTHCSPSMRTAVRKYVRFRESNPKAMKGISKAGLSPAMRNIYRIMQLKASDEMCSYLRWTQKDRDIQKKKVVSFKGLSELEIAEKIRTEKIPVMVALSSLPDKISPVIAVSLLENSTGNQAVILRGLFDKQGLLKEPEVMNLFKMKIKTAKTALDRVEKINTEIDKDVEKVLKTAKSEKRKEQVGDIGKIFVHIDVSGSMQAALEFAKNKGSIIAECVANPEENFYWGAFNTHKITIKKPETFEQDAFKEALYGLQCQGGTDCIAWYERARRLNCDVDVYITDQGHNCGDVVSRISEYDRQGLRRPKAIVIVDCSRGYVSSLKNSFERLNIPVAVLAPNVLNESALISQAVKSAMLGSIAVIDEIMQTPLLKLPYWWSSVK